MGISIQEKLSAYVDDELGEFETRRLTEEVLKSETARRRVAHYQLIGAAMRDEPAAAFEQSFSARVMAEIDALPKVEEEDASEATSGGHSPSRRTPWLKVLVGGAIAASVALVSLTMLRSIDSQMTPATVAVPQVGDVAPAAPESMTASSGTPSAASSDLAKTVSAPVTEVPHAQPIPPVIDNASNARLLGGYLATHAEHAAHRSMLPRARVMGFDLQGSE